MKLIVTFYVLFIVTIFFPTVFSYTNHKGSLYNLLRRPLGTKVNSLVLSPQNDKDLSISIPSQQLHSIENQDNIQIRNAWDSGEDYYFQWANQNRRPVEYLTGRKRQVDKVVFPQRDRRINGGLWRSGLVG